MVEYKAGIIKGNMDKHSFNILVQRPGKYGSLLLASKGPILVCLNLETIGDISWLF